MARSILLSALALALAWPAVAQDRNGARVSPTRPEGRAAAPRVPLAEGAQDPVGLLRLAEGTLAARRLGDTAELLERAESRLLTRSELASTADRPAAGGAIGELAAARDALARRDTAAAQDLIAAAIRRLEAGEAPSVAVAPPSVATGATLAPTPGAGGGPAGAVQLPPPVAGAARPGPAVAGAVLPKTPVVPQLQPVAPLPGTKPPPL